MQTYPDRVENYTTAFLVTAGMILFMSFFTLAATAGFIWVALSAALLDMAIKVGSARADVRDNA